MSAPAFGHPPGVAVGDVFPGRAALARASVHRPVQAGICGTAAAGCESVVLSGGYTDDADLGATILYTGAGGRDRASGHQTEDQALNGWNRALVTSLRLGLPVRVARRVWDAVGAPTAAYRYDGLYRVATYWRETGRDGFRVWRFRLDALPGESAAPAGAAPDTAGVAEPAPGAAPRTLVTVSRVVRDTAVTREVKRLHGFRCQACGARLETPTGPYAEAAHIVPLGAPHHGSDRLDNVLCLCPNHHATFDLYAWAVGELGELIGLDGVLRAAPGHTPSPDSLRAHRARADAVWRDSTPSRNEKL